MVSTRSKTKQTHLEDFAQQDAQQGKSRQTHAGTKSIQHNTTQEDVPKKRKSPATASDKSAPKRSKPSPQAAKFDSAIVINRAPVLQLWSTCLTHFLYPNLPWSTCISAGSAISSICAVAKGRSIGTVPERDDSEAAQRKREDRKKMKKELDEIQVMQFHLKLKDGLAVVGSEKKGKSGDEEGLRKKFGEGAYGKVKGCFEDVLGSWEGDEEGLSVEGFNMYEKFRPDVSGGQKGWGRKGELSLDTIKDVVQKS